MGATLNTKVMPGVWPNVPYEEYDAWDAVNYSKLKYFEKTAMHARYRMTHEPDPTEAREFGKAVHIATLEPQRFEAEYLVKPKTDKRTTRGKQQWAAFEIEAHGRYVLTEEEYESLVAIGAAVRDHPLAGEIVKSPGANEVSAHWIDEKTGLPCKGRWDRFCKVIGYPSLVDMKTTVDASPEGFRREIAKFNYEAQGAFYIDGAYTLSPVERRYVFIAVEKTPPYAVAVYELELDALEEGRKRYRRWLSMYAEATKTNQWPGYSGGLIPISLPKWKFSSSDSGE